MKRLALTSSTCVDGACVGHRVVARYEARVGWADGENGEHWIAASSTGSFDQDGRAELTVPDPRDLRGEVVFEVHAPDGRQLEVEGTTRIPAEQLDNRLELSFKPADTVKLIPPDDPEAGTRIRLKGQVIDLNGRRIASKQVVLFGATTDDPQDGDFRALATAVTDGGGRFSTGYPRGTFSEAYGQVLLGEGRSASAPIRLEEDGSLPREVILVVRADLPIDGDDSCCDPEGNVMRAPDEEDLTDRAGTFSQDLGGGRCIDFTKPDRVLEEFSYRFIVRTTDPVVKPQKLDPPDIKFAIPPGILGNLGLFTGNFAMTAGKGDTTTASGPVPLSSDLQLSASAIKAGKRNPSIFNNSGVLSGLILHDKIKDWGRLLDIAKPKPPNRVDVSCETPIDWDDDPTSYQACTIAHGHILTYKQQWVADGYSMGNLLYSLPLAPGQKKQIAIVDWERRESAARSEILSESEALTADLSRERDVNDIVNAVLTETLEGSSESFNFGMGGGHGSSGGFGGALMGVLSFGATDAIAGSLGFGSSSASLSASRDLSSSALQSLRDWTRQSSSFVRARRSTTVETVSQGERTVAQSESVANYNHCHAVTMQYFEVLRHMLVRHRLVDVQECLFIPLMMSRFTPDKVLQWQEPLARTLRDRSLLGGFGAVDRILNGYEGSGLPVGAYADEDLTHLSGDLTLRFQLVAPEAEEYDAALWSWYGSRSALFGMSAATLHAALRAREESYHEAFQSLAAPKIARQVADQLVIRAGSRTLDLDYTLTSDYRHDTPLNVTVRINGSLSGLRRRDIDALEIRPVAPGTLPPGSRIIVEGGRLSYRTRFASGTLFNDRRVRNDLTDGDGVVIPTPLSQAELREPREEDRMLQRRLLEHLNDHIEYYHRAIWTRMSPDRRYMMLDGFIAPGSSGRSVASVVDNRIIGIVGNSIVMPVAKGLRLDPSFQENDGTTLLEHYKPAVPDDPLRIAIPTKGVYAEAVMGQCNSCEHKEEDRFWRWEESPIPDSPTPIQPLSTETRRATPPDLTPTPASAPVVAFQNVPAAPDPQGLSAALQLLGTPGIFKDITGLEGNQRNAIEALKASLEAAQKFGAEAADVAKSFGQYATNLGMQSATSQNMDRIQRSIQTARTQGLINDDQASSLTHAALRGMIGQGTRPEGADPESAQTMLNTIRSARDQGSIDTNQEQDLAGQVLRRMANQGETIPEPRLDQNTVNRIVDGAGPDQNLEISDGNATITRGAGSTFSIDYTVPGRIPNIRQTPGSNRCWAAAAAILLSWRDNRPYSPIEAARLGGSRTTSGTYLDLYNTDGSLVEGDQNQFASALGMTVEPPMSRPVESWLQLLQQHGPLWIQSDLTPTDPASTHMIVVYGMYGDGNPADTFLRIMDPWSGPRTQRYDHFMADLERIAREAIDLDLPFLIQIAHY